jgi:hypothetical protein
MTHHQNTAERVAALKTLLPLLEAHLDNHGRIVARAQWISTYEPPPPGYVPPTPEPPCAGDCRPCPDFGVQCGLREVAWAREWDSLRGRYPHIFALEELLYDLAFVHPEQASATYWGYVQPWDAFDRPEWAARAEAGVEWIEERFVGYVPTYVPKRQRAVRNTSDAERDALIIQLRIDGLSHNAIHNRVGCSKTTVGAVLRGLDVRRGRIINANSA